MLRAKDTEQTVLCLAAVQQRLALRRRSLRMRQRGRCRCAAPSQRSSSQARAEALAGRASCGAGHKGLSLSKHGQPAGVPCRSGKAARIKDTHHISSDPSVTYNAALQLRLHISLLTVTSTAVTDLYVAWSAGPCMS